MPKKRPSRLTTIISKIRKELGAIDPVIVAELAGPIGSLIAISQRMASKLKKDKQYAFPTAPSRRTRKDSVST